ncbi:MAG: hypothetical protein K9L78_04535 [Victivallales bacterium]|nr:hypothetical protein [Victivallales bacterium]MCF7889370.1 hypothetical protein [Victivallales bacterium]
MKSFRKLDESNYTKIGIILIVAGVLFGLDEIFNVTIFQKLWPALTLILSIGFIGIYKYTKIKSSLYLIIGEALLLLSFLAFICNFYSWSILINLWPIFITFLGIILLTLYLIHKDKTRLLLAGIATILISIYFYMHINYDNSFWWALFIIGGVSLIIIRKKQ